MAGDEDLKEFWSEFFFSAGIEDSYVAKYSETFVANRMTRPMLEDLDKTVLREVGVVAMGDIIAILKHAKFVVEEEKYSLSPIKSVKIKSVVVSPVKNGVLVKNVAAAASHAAANAGLSKTVDGKPKPMRIVISKPLKMGIVKEPKIELGSVAKVKSPPPPTPVAITTQQVVKFVNTEPLPMSPPVVVAIPTPNPAKPVKVATKGQSRPKTASPVVTPSKSKPVKEIESKAETDSNSNSQKSEISDIVLEKSPKLEKVPTPPRSKSAPTPTPTALMQLKFEDGEKFESQSNCNCKHFEGVEEPAKPPKSQPESQNEGDSSNSTLESESKSEPKSSAHKHKKDKKKKKKSKHHHRKRNHSTSSASPSDEEHRHGSRKRDKYASERKLFARPKSRSVSKPKAISRSRSPHHKRPNEAFPRSASRSRTHSQSKPNSNSNPRISRSRQIPAPTLVPRDSRLQQVPIINVSSSLSLGGDSGRGRGHSRGGGGGDIRRGGEHRNRGGRGRGALESRESFLARRHEALIKQQLDLEVLRHGGAPRERVPSHLTEQQRMDREYLLRLQEKLERKNTSQLESTSRPQSRPRSRPRSRSSRR